MRVGVIGYKGQLGTALQEVLAGHDWLGLDLPEYDITELDPLQQALQKFAPKVVVHTAAYTHVDGCARNPDRALRVNALGTQNVALACEAVGAALLYISTNEVFAGDREDPYLEYDPPNPINPYGYSKWVGERYVAQLCRRFYIVRTSWLFGGASNFVSKILALSQEHSELTVVDDEFGAPTYAPDLAAAVVRLMGSGRYGIYHLVNEGWCSRYDLAVESLRLAGRAHIPVRRIKLAEFQRPSTPPPRAILRNFCAAEGLGIRLRPWQKAVAAYLQEG
jgi:dTDP-4-dehydrorhamnose reductase